MGVLGGCVFLSVRYPCRVLEIGARVPLSQFVHNLNAAGPTSRAESPVCPQHLERNPSLLQAGVD